MKTILTAAVLAMTATAAYPASLTLTDITAAWTGHTGSAPAVNIADGADRDTIFWGNGRFGQSGYTFDRAAPGTTHAPDASFSLGTFTHDNFVVDRGVDTAALDVTFSFFLGNDSSNIITRTSQFVFSHYETPNVPASGVCVNGKPSKPGGVQVGCEDRVIPVTNPSSSETFTITEGGVEYTYLFDVTGFNRPEGFWTVENDTNSAELMARYTVEENLAPVPLPAAAWMLLAGIGALFSRRIASAAGRFGDWFSAERGAGEGRNGWV